METAESADGGKSEEHDRRIAQQNIDVTDNMNNGKIIGIFLQLACGTAPSVSPMSGVAV
jgi:hypothetical protein